MRKRLLFGIYALAVILISSSNLSAADPAQSAWADFRKQFSYHVQTIALFDQHYLIISEPPPHVTLQGLTSLDPALLTQPRVFKHSMGVDGWLKDIVFELPQIDDPRLTDLLDSIHLYVFGTTYKAEVLQLPGSTSRASRSGPSAHLDLRVSAADIYRWTFAENEQFSKVGRVEAALPTAILNSGDTGVYYSNKPGLVLWVLPRDLDITKRRREARQFAVDSDLILGAISSPTRFAIVARERILPSSSLPPLRFETIELLASVRRRDLAQSYERTYLLAGRMDNVRQDWAPIYLSPELIDTEYGSLLNMTDQMLKSWTEAGRVRYVNFDYPDPNGFPFGTGGLADTEQTVTYNWNTTGVGYRATFGSYPVFALNRTGALAVSYIAGESQRLAAKEDHAYSYFSQLNNPDLARVVQYAAIYQIFRDVRLHDLGLTPSETENPALEPMTELTLGTLRTIRDVDFTDRIDHSAPGSAQFQRDLIACRNSIVSVSRTYGEAGMKDLAGRFAEFRNETQTSFLAGGILRKNALASVLVTEAITNCREAVIQVGGKQMRAGAFEAYRKAWDRPDSGWVRTASVVVSHWTAPEGRYLTLVGGHNLYSKITKLREDPSLPAGKISILKEDNEIVIVHSKFDRAKVHELVRVAARELEHPLVTKLSLRSALEAELVRVRPIQRTRIEALDYQRFASGSRSFQRTLSSNEPMPQTGVRNGAQFDSQAVPANLREVASTKGHVVVLRNPNGTYQLIFGGLANPIEVKSMPALVDQILDPVNLSSNPSEMQLHLAGFTPEEGSGFLKNVEFQMLRQANDSSVLTGIVEKNGNVSPEVVRKLNTQFDFSRGTLSEPRITLIEDGPLQGGHLFDARLEVPARIPSRPSIWMRIRIFFSEKLPEAVSAAIYRSLDSVLARLGDKRASLKVQARELKREILRICPDAKHVELELNDFTITERWEIHFDDQLLAKSAQAA